MTRGQRGRALAKAELCVALFAGAVIPVFVFIAAPQSMGPPPPEWLTFASLSVWALGVGTGLIWMVRIYRTDPEPDQRAWRYRARN